jgi:hypothetical protein
MKVVINNCFGGFGLSPEATLKLWEMGCKDIEAFPVDEYYGDRDDGILGRTANLEKWRGYLAMTKKQRKAERHLFLTVFTPDEKFVLNARGTTRHDPMLIQVIEDMGKDANAGCADLKVVEIPDDVKYVIQEYDGNEHIAEEHRTWR